MVSIIPSFRLTRSRAWSNQSQTHQDEAAPASESALTPSSQRWSAMFFDDDLFTLNEKLDERPSGTLFLAPAHPQPFVTDRWDNWWNWPMQGRNKSGCKGFVGPSNQRELQVAEWSTGIPSHIEADRVLRLDAAVIRVMKRQQTLSHDALRTEVEKVLYPRFTVPPELLLERVVSLVERGFLEPTKGDAASSTPITADSRYHYVA